MREIHQTQRDLQEELKKLNTEVALLVKNADDWNGLFLKLNTKFKDVGDLYHAASIIEEDLDKLIEVKKAKEALIEEQKKKEEEEAANENIGDEVDVEPLDVVEGEEKAQEDPKE